MAPSHSYEQEDCDAPYRENAENVCVRQASMSQQYIVNKVSSDGKTHTPKKHARQNLACWLKFANPCFTV